MRAPTCLRRRLSRAEQCQATVIAAAWKHAARILCSRKPLNTTMRDEPLHRLHPCIPTGFAVAQRASRPRPTVACRYQQAANHR
jgi:hypothetical protein